MDGTVNWDVIEWRRVVGRDTKEVSRYVCECVEVWCTLVGIGVVGRFLFLECGGGRGGLWNRVVVAIWIWTVDGWFEVRL
jgi:hypothetical protein